MKKLSLRSAALLIVLCCFAAGAANAGVVTIAFPSAGNAYCSVLSGCGTIPAGGQSGFMANAGDNVQSASFSLPNNSSITGITANWFYQDFLGNWNGTPTTETWFVYINSTPVAFLPRTTMGITVTSFRLVVL